MLMTSLSTERSASAPNDHPPDSDGKTTAELAGDLTRQITGLVHSEIQLAKAEVSEKGRRFGLGAGGFGLSGLMGVFGLGCLVAAAVVAVHLEVVLWAACLAVGFGCLAVAAFAALLARRQVKKATPPVPTQAIESTKEDVQWVKTQARSANR
jgi:Putative Actinobacterial Holin-X, holin superfamily III